MKVAYFFRSPRKGVFSIEVLFERIIRAMDNKIDGYTFRVSAKSTIWACVQAFFKQKQINHITGHVHFLMLVLSSYKTILTVHDIGHYEQTLSGWKRKVYKKIWFDWPIKNARYITTVSEFTKQKLIDNFHVSPQKVQVIYNPYPLHYLRQEKSILSPVCNILQIGSGTHKNAERLIEAVKGIPCHLLLVRQYDGCLDQKIKEAGITCTWYFDLTEQDLYRLYVDCDIVYFASTYEGFGMPIIEAQAVGRAVITSTIASMPEVAGEGAILVNPYRTEDIRSAVLRLIKEDDYRNQLIHKGYENIRRFHPDKIAMDYLNLYQRILKQ